jgi:hypothetical protein
MVAQYSLHLFVAPLAEHVPDRFRHAIRILACWRPARKGRWVQRCRKDGQGANRLCQGTSECGPHPEPLASRKNCLAILHSPANEQTPEQAHEIGVGIGTARDPLIGPGRALVSASGSYLR